MHEHLFNRIILRNIYFRLSRPFHANKWLLFAFIVI